MKYRDFTPTALDRHIKVDGRDDWEVIPFATRNRDSNALETSNFEFTESALKEVQEEGKNWEIMRFGHWACGWFEIMVFNPECQEIKSKVDSVFKQYQNYIVLDEERYLELTEESETEEE